MKLSAAKQVHQLCPSRLRTLTRADHVQVTALARALKVNVRIAYLDGRGSGDAVEFVEFQNRADGVETERSGSNEVVLLYRCVLRCCLCVCS